MRAILAYCLALALLLAGLPAYAQERPTSWDLTDLYADEAAVEDTISKMQDLIARMPNYRGTLNTVQGVLAWYQFHEEYIIEEARLICYATMLTNLNAGDSAAQTLLGRANNLRYEADAASAFVMPEILGQSEEFLDSVERDAAFADHLHSFQRLRVESAHNLSEEQENLLRPLDRLVSGARNIYDSLSYLELPYPDIEFPDGVVRPADENGYTLALFGGFSQEFRKEFYETMLKTKEDFRNTLAQNFQNYCYGVSENAKAHNYSSALEEDLLKENVDADLYQAVIDASLRGSEIVGQYAEVMKKELGLDQINICDMNLPIAVAPDKTYTYDEACELVLKALEPMGEKYVTDARQALSGGWVDVYPAEGKRTGAYAMSIAGKHPYMLLNFDSTFNGVSTLAHELGHVMHQWYSVQAQPTVYRGSASGVVSEVASTLNQLLLADYMIENAQSASERKFFIAEEMRTIYSNFFIQSQFARFQQVSMEALEKGETLTADKLEELWLENFLLYDGGGAIKGTDYYGVGWSRVPHFYQGFYTYQYAMAISASCAIAQRIVTGEAGAVDDYLAYLSAGDTGSAAEMLAIAGVDATNNGFIDGLLTRFETLMEEFEAA